MPFFTDEFISFFEELHQNNDKEWFDENRERYVDHVREPFKDFAEVVAFALTEFDRDIILKPHIYRINYDLRFKDREDLYKTYKSASFNINNWKSPLPRYYIQIGLGGIRLGGGMYSVDTKDKYRVRAHIYNNLEEFKELKEAEEFVETYGGIQGKKHKRIPKILREVAEEEPVLYNKNFYYMTDLPLELIHTDKIINKVAETFRVIYPLNKFFREAIIADNIL